MNRHVKRAGLSVASALVALAAVLASDRLIVGHFVGTAPLIFPAHEQYRYHTSEFSAVARANGMGFRDREFSPAPAAGVTRMLALGDSFTYGWGVEDEEPWPKVVERRLRNAGGRVEIANAGQPGADPAAYAALAQQAIPMLRPSIIIVGVLQGDDLAQLMGGGGGLSPEPRWRSAAHAAVPNLLRLRASWRERAVDRAAGDPWKGQAASVLAQFAPDERARFAALGDDVRGAFLSGNLNPELVALAVQAPDRLVEADDPDREAVGAAITRMGGYLSTIKRVASASASAAEVIVVSVPYPPYASPRDYRNVAHVGFTLVPDMPSSTRADAAIRRACQLADVPFVSVTAEFRRAAAARELFFALDGHLTRAGHEVFASLVESALAAHLPELRHAAR